MSKQRYSWVCEPMVYNGYLSRYRRFAIGISRWTVRIQLYNVALFVGFAQPIDYLIPPDAE